MKGKASRRRIFSIVLVALCMAIGGCYEVTVGTTGDGAADTVYDDGGATDGADDQAGDSVEEGEGPVPDWASCRVPSDCVIVANGCCDTCGLPTLADVDAVNKSLLDEHFDDVCGVPIPCPQCITMPNPELIATCREGLCLAMDVGDDELTACTSSEDCVIRTPECCECGADMTPGVLIAIRSDSRRDLEELVCDPDYGCLECEPDYPDNVEAVCDDDSHCTARIIPPPE